MRRAQKCPYCGAMRVRVAHVHTLGDYWRLLHGSFPARCAECSARFIIRGPGFGALFNAECPRCLRQDLSTWDPRHYHATFWMRVRLFFGASRWRCEACRCNFISFLRRKEKYVPPGERAETVPDSGGSAI
ncbi:MAG: hypothetical protein ACLQBJ_04660 [Bryobacteraceae bacterium]